MADSMALYRNEAEHHGGIVWWGKVAQDLALESRERNSSSSGTNYVQQSQAPCDPSPVTLYLPTVITQLIPISGSTH